MSQKEKTSAATEAGEQSAESSRPTVPQSDRERKAEMDQSYLSPAPPPERFKGFSI